MMVLLIPIFLLPITVYADFTSDLENVILVHACEPTCTFNYSEITSKTIESFPRTCENVCGILVLNENTDLTEAQLTDYFGNMTTLFGGLRVENTLFEGLSIFKGRVEYWKKFHFFCKTFGLSISNNTQLKNIDFLNDFFLWLDKKTDECPLEFENNPKLDASHLCQDIRYKDLFELRITGNLKDCGCRGDLITTDNIESFENCTIFNGGLHLFNITISDISSLSNIVKVRGDVELQMTQIQNLSFLKKLKTIEVKHGLRNEKTVMNIHDNYEMTRFGMSSLKILNDLMEGPFVLNLENLHPEFCLTFQEMIFFLQEGISFENIHAKFCADIEKIDGFCEFKTMKRLEENCYYIHGNVVIGAGDEEYLYKLEDMTFLFGTLTIKNTKLENLNFLVNLNFIGSLEDDEYVIEIMSNKNLTSAELPNLKNIISKGGRTIVIQNNPLLVTDGCMIFPMTFQTNVAFIGDNCENSSWALSINFWIGLAFLYFSEYPVSD